MSLVLVVFDIPLCFGMAFCWLFVLVLCVYIIMYCTNRIMDMLLVLLTFTMYYSTCMCLSSGLIFLQRPLGVQSLKKIVLTLNMYLSVLVT